MLRTLLFIGAMIAGFWKMLGHESVFDAPLHEPDILSSTVALERERQAAIGADAKMAADKVLDKPDGRRTRVQETQPQKTTRLLSDEYLNAAFCGCCLMPGNKLKKHGSCTHPLKRKVDGSCELACHHNLWPGGTPQLSSHVVDLANMTQAARSQWIYERLVGEHYADTGDSGAVQGVALTTHNKAHTEALVHQVN